MQKKVNHTNNALKYIKAFAGIGYKGEYYYIESTVVRDGNIVTANGFSAPEFCREIHYALDTYSPQMIDKNYRMNKTGVWEAPKTE